MTTFHPAAFADPPADYRPVAMWFLNGDLDEAEIVRQVQAMADGGLGGVQIAARSGLTVPYLSARWFHLVGRALAEATGRGLRVWLADEYPYPSGASGGEVILRHPEYRAWRMRATRVTAAPGEDVRAAVPGTVFLRACAVPILRGAPRWDDPVPLDDHVGIVQHQQVLFRPTRVHLTDRRYMVNGPRPTLAWRAPPGPDAWEVWLIGAAEIEAYKFFGAYVDLCNPDAVRAFLQTTYQRYLDALGPERFARLAGFFVDEAHPQNWSWHLPDAFRRRNGYDLYDALPALWTDAGPRTPRVRYDYLQTITELFVESFHRPLAAWCRQHGVQLSLEVGSTRNVVQRHADVPGIDPGHEKVGAPLDETLARELPSFRGNLTFPASLAAQTGKRRVLDELFHSVGWSLTLQDMKAMLDRAAARGANLFAFHAFCYTVGGLRKWDAPPSQFDQNPYWPHLPLLAAYAGRLAYALSRGRRHAPVALLDPIASLWAHGEATGAGRDATADRIREDWTYLMRELAAHQRPHDNLDPLLLAEATVENGALRVGEAEYRAVVLPPLTALEPPAWQRLAAFAESGGTVIACGMLPWEELEPGSDLVARCAAAFDADPQRLRQDYEAPPGATAALAVTRRGAFVLLRTIGTLAQSAAAAQLLDLLEEAAPAAVRLSVPDDPPARRHFLLAHRRDGDQDLIFIANGAIQEYDCELTLRPEPGRPVHLSRLDLEGGAEAPLHGQPTGDGTELRLRLPFPRHGAHLLRLSRPPATPPPPPPPRPTPHTVDLDLAGNWRCTPAAENVLRLDRFRFTLGDAAGAERPDAPLIEPQPLINTLQELSARGEAWPAPIAVTPIFGAPPRLHLPLPATVSYGATFRVTSLPPAATLCLEPESLSGAWAISLNGHPLDGNAWTARRRWSVGLLEAEVGALLRPGTNHFQVRLEAQESWDGLLSPVYLLGDFGVTYDPAGSPILGERPTTVRWEDLFDPAGGVAGAWGRRGSRRGGYAHYAGTLHLRRSVHLPRATDEGLILRFPDEPLMFAGVAQLTLNERPLRVRPWAPYAWRVPADAVRPGPNELTLSVTNTLFGLFE